MSESALQALNWEGPPRGAAVLFRRLARLAWKHRLQALPAVGATIAFQALTLGGLAGQGLAIDVVRAAFDPESPPVRWPFGIEPPAEWDFPVTMTVVCIGVLLISIVAGFARLAIRWGDELFVQACVVDLRRRLYEKLQNLGLEFFDAVDTGQVINRVAGDAQKVRAFIQGIMIRAGIAAVTLAIFLWYMIGTHPMLTLACCSVYPLQIIVMTRYSRITKPKFLQQSKLVDIVIKVLQESIAGVRVIRVFGREAERTAAFDRRVADAVRQRLDIARDQARSLPFIQASNIIAQGILLGYGGWLILEHARTGGSAGIALGTFWVFRGLLDRLAQQAEAIVSIIAETPETLAGAERVFSLLDAPIVILALPRSANDPPIPPINGRVEFRNVTFGYTPGRPVLHNISFTVNPGETIAIVGPTGSGKSTLLSLIPRLYEASTGQILIDGTDVREMNVNHLRRNIAMVFQEPFLFSNTIGSNIAFGVPSATNDELRQATEDAAADDFINEMPHGLDTIIGERGTSLSGGQRQRLTIARALATHPPILILDDATGSVDALTESEIQQALSSTYHRRTTFVVAHRLSTLRRADRVIVLEKGRITDTGTHHELMSRPGHYRQAALIQLEIEGTDPIAPTESRP